VGEELDDRERLRRGVEEGGEVGACRVIVSEVIRIYMFISVQAVQAICCKG